MDYILCCVDKGSYSLDICKYAVFVANNMNLPLKLLNTVEKNEKTKELNLSGNIKLGERDDILEELTQKQAKISKENIKKSKEFLEDLKQNIKDSCNNEITILQVHGEILDAIKDLEYETKVLILGIHSKENHIIGDNIKNIIKSTKKPILLVNNQFQDINKILLAYNGSKESKRLLQTTSNNPILGKKTKRTIITLGTDLNKANKLLNEAKEIFLQKNIQVNTSFLKGENEDIILEYFENQKYDILAMGAYGHSWIKELVFGSFTTKILSKIKKPILLFR